MKKKLLLVVLALAILTSLTAGTLAVYTRTVTETEKIEAKRFTFNAVRVHCRELARDHSGAVGVDGLQVHHRERGQ